MKTPEHIVPAYNLPKDAAMEAAEAAQSTAAAEAVQWPAEAAEAAQAAQAPEGRPPAAAESARADPRRGDINDAMIALRIVLQSSRCRACRRCCLDRFTSRPAHT